MHKSLGLGLLPTTGDMIRAWLPWVIVACALIILVVALVLFFSSKKAKKSGYAPKNLHKTQRKDSKSTKNLR